LCRANLVLPLGKDVLAFEMNIFPSDRVHLFWSHPHFYNQPCDIPKQRIGRGQILLLLSVRNNPHCSRAFLKKPHTAHGISDDMLLANNKIEHEPQHSEGPIYRRSRIVWPVHD
jgi:hypothetical protein